MCDVIGVGMTDKTETVPCEEVIELRRRLSDLQEDYRQLLLTADDCQEKLIQSKMNGETTVYVFEYCSCIYEAGYTVESVHLTKKGAWKAKHQFIWDRFEQYAEYKRLHGVRHPFLAFDPSMERARVRKLEIKL